MRRYTFILLFGIVQLFLWSCTKDNGADKNVSQQEMRVVPSVLQTRAGMDDVADIHAFMINVKSSANSKYDYYAAVKPSGIQWLSYNVAADGTVGETLQMLWADATSPVTATALYLADNILPNDKYGNAEIAVVNDQTTEDGVKSGDYLYMTSTEFYPTTDNGAVNVTFSHLMAKLNITLNLGTEFNVNPGTEENPITKVSVVGVSGKRVFDVVNNSWSDVTGSASAEVNPYCNSYLSGSGISNRAVAKYEAILIPETIPSGTFGLSITVNDKTYNWTSQEEILFESNYSYNIPVTVGKNYVTVGNIQIADWNTGAELADGETDVEDVNVWDGVSVATSLTEGTGSEDDPYVITSGAQLAYIASVTNTGAGPEFGFSGKYFILNNDIDLGGHPWTPIGYSSGAHSKSFYGSFDGNGHTIYNLKTVEETNADGSPIGKAFFGSLGNGNGKYSVKNLNIKDAEIGSIGYGAILAASASNSRIFNCHVSGTVNNAKSDYDENAYNATSGLIAWASDVKVKGSTADVELHGDGCTGGIVGQSSYSTFENCSAKGELYGAWSVGGFAGEFALGSHALDCSSSVNVNANDWNVGGFVGFFGGYDSYDDISYITGCSASGRVYQNLNGGDWDRCLGGMIGRIYRACATDCKFTGTVDDSDANGNAYVGAFIGYDIYGGMTVRCSYRNTGVPGTGRAIGVIVSESSSSHDIKAE